MEKLIKIWRASHLEVHDLLVSPADRPGFPPLWLMGLLHLFPPKAETCKIRSAAPRWVCPDGRPDKFCQRDSNR